VIVDTLDATLLGALDEEDAGRRAAVRRGDRDGQAGAPQDRPRQAQGGLAGWARRRPALLETVERALLMLKKAKTEPEGGACAR